MINAQSLLEIYEVLFVYFSFIVKYVLWGFLIYLFLFALGLHYCTQNFL